MFERLEAISVLDIRRWPVCSPVPTTCIYGITCIANHDIGVACSFIVVYGKGYKKLLYVLNCTYGCSYVL